MLHHPQEVQLNCVQAESLNHCFAKIKLDTNQQSETADFFNDPNSGQRLLQGITKHVTDGNHVSANVISILPLQRIQD